MTESKSHWPGAWRHLVESPVSVDDVDRVVERGSIPDFSFCFMLAASAVIATLGLLANSAAVIIGAMIVAPLMSPIISMSFGIVAGKRALATRSLLSVVTGTALTIAVAFLLTDATGWKLVGSEIIARMNPSLLDLGVALAAGAAAAFAYTRPNVSSALAGIAIAVALIPPLCTVGIILALGQDASPEAGLALDRVSARGPFLLYLTNIIGIVFAGGMVFFLQYFRRRLTAALTLMLVLSSLVIVVPPLGVSMDNLLVRNQVRRSLSVETQALLSAGQGVRFTGLNTRIVEGVVYVRGDVVAAHGLLTQALIDELRERLSDRVSMPVSLELGITPETVIHSSE